MIYLGSNMKYYFIDNGLLNRFLTDANTSLTGKQSGHTPLS